MNEFLIRTVVGAIAVSIIAAFIYLGGYYFQFLLFLFVTIGGYELVRAFKKLNINMNYYLILICALFGQFDINYNSSLTWTLYLALLLFSINILINNDVIGSALAFFLTCYLLIGFYSMYLIDKKIFIGLIFIIAFSTDSFAYIFGNLFGKHKLAPKISPNKSVEGAIGGIFGAVVISMLYIYLFYEIDRIHINILIIIICSITGQCGDLLASRIKRYTGVKDFGKLMPGHGGILDRFDSVIAVTPMIYFLYTLI